MHAAIHVPDMLVISHSADRAGAPMVLLRFLDWMSEDTTVDVNIVLLHGGPMEDEFARFDARVLGGADSRLWMLERGLTNLHFDRAANGLAWARQAPTMWARRGSPLVLLNSVGSLPAMRFMPRTSTSQVVLYVHELDDSLERTLGSAAWDLLHPRVDHFVACGDRVADMLSQRKGIDPDRISRHPGFVDPPPTPPPSGREHRRRLGIPPTALVVGASGRFEWRKGPEVLVRVARALADRRPDLDLHVVWMGGHLDDSPAYKLRHDVDHAGLTDRFHLLGETRQPAEAMSMFDLYAVTSREEPYPLTMLEAASLGVPVVSFDNGGAVEFATAGPGGPRAEIVPYLDVAAMTTSMERLLDDPEERAALRKRARERVLSHHTTAHAAPRLFETLVELQPRLARKTRRRPAGAHRPSSVGAEAGFRWPRPPGSSGSSDDVAC